MNNDDLILIQQIGYKAFAALNPALKATSDDKISELDPKIREALRERTDADARLKIHLRRELREKKKL